MKMRLSWLSGALAIALFSIVSLAVSRNPHSASQIARFACNMLLSLGVYSEIYGAIDFFATKYGTNRAA